MANKLKGIDISHYESDVDISKIKNEIDFIICKATEGKSFIDNEFKSLARKTLNNNLLFGFYHFAKNNDPETEAIFFHNITKEFDGRGIPILDYEVENSNNVTWCEKFLYKYYELTKVFPLLYISASRCKQYTNSSIVNKSDLWIAGYPSKSIQSFNDTLKMPYKVAPWNYAAIWQFTDKLILKNYANLDGNFAYMSKEAWEKYCIGDKKQETNNDNKKSCEEIADEIIAGKWGNGWNRKNAIVAAYDLETYNHAQAIVNKKVGK